MGFFQYCRKAKLLVGLNTQQTLTWIFKQPIKKRIFLQRFALVDDSRGQGFNPQALDFD